MSKTIKKTCETCKAGGINHKNEYYCVFNVTVELLELIKDILQSNTEPYPMIFDDKNLSCPFWQSNREGEKK